MRVAKRNHDAFDVIYDKKGSLIC